MHIRQNTLADERRVLQIWRDAVDATHHFLSVADRQTIEAEVATFLPQAQLWLAVDEGNQPLGFMLLDGPHMEALFIDPSRHGCGIGRTLIEHALNTHPTVTTDVNEQNHQAVGFYEHLGFERTGRTETDSQGRPYPLLHMRRRLTVSTARES